VCVCAFACVCVCSFVCVCVYATSSKQNHVSCSCRFHPPTHPPSESHELSMSLPGITVSHINIAISTKFLNITSSISHLSLTNSVSLKQASNKCHELNKSSKPQRTSISNCHELNEQYELSESQADIIYMSRTQ